MGESEARLWDLQVRLAEYERPLPDLVNGRFHPVNDHRWSPDGLCIRCGMDAEDEGGCVESYLNDLLDCEQRMIPVEILRDINLVASTISIIHHRKQWAYADGDALLAAERLLRWAKEQEASVGHVPTQLQQDSTGGEAGADLSLE